MAPVIVSIQTEPHVFEFSANWFRKISMCTPPQLLLLSFPAYGGKCEQTVCLTHFGVCCYGAGEESGSHSNIRLTRCTSDHWRSSGSGLRDPVKFGADGMWCTGEFSRFPSAHPPMQRNACRPLPYVTQISRVIIRRKARTHTLPQE